MIGNELLDPRTNSLWYLNQKTWRTTWEPPEELAEALTRRAREMKEKEDFAREARRGGGSRRIQCVPVVGADRQTRMMMLLRGGGEEPPSHRGTAEMCVMSSSPHLQRAARRGGARDARVRPTDILMIGQLTL